MISPPNPSKKKKKKEKKKTKTNTNDIQSKTLMFFQIKWVFTLFKNKSTKM